MATVHVHKSAEQGIFSNAYIIDTGNSLVVVDGTLTVSEARAFGAQLKSMAIADSSSERSPDRKNE